jgi:hypothetical protein
MGSGLPKATTDTPLSNNPAVLDVANNTGGKAFTLESKGSDPDALLTKITIKDVNAADLTFTLIATWTKPTTSPIKASDIGATFTYEITVIPPTAGTLSPPAPGTITLSGGSDAVAVSVPATKASATVIAG